MLRSGWFSDRSATYLAAGRPVVTQETGFSNVLPTGEGLYGFSTLDEAAAVVEEVSADYERARAGRPRGRPRVLRRRPGAGRHAGRRRRVGPGRGRPARPRSTPTCASTPVSRRPLELPPETAATSARRTALPFGPRPGRANPRRASWSPRTTTSRSPGSAWTASWRTRESPAYELIVVDNGSRDGSRAYLKTLERRFPHVRLVLNGGNRGFPAACNQGLAIARGRAARPAEQRHRGAAGLAGAARRARGGPVGRAGRAGDQPHRQRGRGRGRATRPTASSSRRRASAPTRAAASGSRSRCPRCSASRSGATSTSTSARSTRASGSACSRTTTTRERAHRPSYASVCAEDVLIHHFGEGSIGRLFDDGAYTELLDGEPPALRAQVGQDLGALRAAPGRRVRGRARARARARRLATARRGGDRRRQSRRRGAAPVPAAARPALPADGRRRLRRPLPGRQRRGDRASSSACASRAPTTSCCRARACWWLDYYAELGEHLAEHYSEAFSDDACVVFELKKVAV